VLTVISLDLVFFVIVPFFLLGIYKLSTPADVAISSVYATHRLTYNDVFGDVAGELTALAIVLAYRCGLALWLLTLIDFVMVRRWYVVPLLLLGPLPITYCYSGPYREQIMCWAFPL
jgi:hypothetical protein